MKIQFNMNDKVLLSSIASSIWPSFFGVRISSIAGYIYFEDRSSLNYKDLRESTAKLIAADLILYRNKKFYLTKKLQEFKRNFRKELGKGAYPTEYISVLLDGLNDKFDYEIQELPNDFCTDYEWERTWDRVRIEN